MNNYRITPREISRLANSLFHQASYSCRLIQTLRPYICPFEILLSWVPEGSHVLDIGCGSGLFLGVLTRMGRIASGLGIDLSEAALMNAARMSQSLPKPHRSSLAFERHDLVVSWPDGKYDVVSLIDIIHHIPPMNQQDFLQTAARHVRTDGILLFKDISQKPAWRAWANTAHDVIMSHDIPKYADMSRVISWMEEKGLHLMETMSINRLWYGHVLGVFHKTKGEETL